MVWSLCVVTAALAAGVVFVATARMCGADPVELLDRLCRPTSDRRRERVVAHPVSTPSDSAVVDWSADPSMDPGLCFTCSGEGHHQCRRCLGTGMH